MKRVLSVFACVSAATLVFSALVVAPVTLRAATSCESLTSLTLRTRRSPWRRPSRRRFTQFGARGGRGGDAASTCLRSAASQRR
jgi:hypothetical protein